MVECVVVYFFKCISKESIPAITVSCFSCFLRGQEQVHIRRNSECYCAWCTELKPKRAWYVIKQWCLQSFASVYKSDSCGPTCLDTDTWANIDVWARCLPEKKEHLGEVFLSMMSWRSSVAHGHVPIFGARLNVGTCTTKLHHCLTESVVAIVEFES